MIKNFKLKKYLRLTPPENIDITHQIYADYSEEEMVMCTWDHYTLRYFISMASLVGGYSHDNYWAAMEKRLKSQAVDNKLRIVKVGSYQTEVGRNVSYRIYQFNTDEKKELKAFHLISSKHVAYWLESHMQEETDIMCLNDEMQTIVSSARIVAPKSQLAATA